MTFGRLVVRIFSMLCLAITAFAVIANGPYVDNPAVFELDGDIPQNFGMGGADWSNAGLTASGLGPEAVATTVPDAGFPPAPASFPYLLIDPPGRTIFTQGGSKDTNDVSQWKYTSGSVPDKDEISHAFAAAYQVDTNNGAGGANQPHIWIYFGATRFANNGDSNIGFWFFQNEIGLAGDVAATSATPFSGTPCPAGSTNCQAGELHRNGDILIVSEFTQGGTIGTITVFEWQGGALTTLSTLNNDQCTPGSPSHVFCAISNSGADPIAAPAAWGYTPKFGAANTLPQGSFFEGGIDLTQVFLDAGLPVPCFSSFLAETRSSQTANAQLKDFVLGNFNLCSVAIDKTCTGSTIVNGSQVQYSFTGNVINDGAATIYLGANPVTDTPPANCSISGFTQPSAPSGIPAGSSAGYSGTLLCSATLGSSDQNRVSVVASSTSGGAANIGPETANWGDPTVPPCPPAVTPGLTLAKTCKSCLVPGSGGLVVNVGEAFKVCNTGNVNVSAISVQDCRGTISGSPGSQTCSAGGFVSIATGQSIAAGGACLTFTSSYTPTSIGACSSGNCSFADQAIASGTAALGGGTVYANGGTPVQATCPLCPIATDCTPAAP